MTTDRRRSKRTVMFGAICIQSTRHLNESQDGACTRKKLARQLKREDTTP